MSQLCVQPLAVTCCYSLAHLSGYEALAQMLADMSQLIPLPPLPAWAQQLAGILPLSALVEFTDIGMKLHLFELAGSISLWNWPVTPAGARLLLSQQGIYDSCCLDHIDRSTTLHCIDGRYGDCYPSSTATTTRLCMSLPKTNIVLSNKALNMANDRNRKQKLKLLYLSRRHDSSSLPSRPSTTAFCVRLYRAFAASFHTGSLNYLFVSAGGWLAWLGFTVISFIAGWYFAAVYLLLMPMTGLVVYFTHGGKPRRLLDERQSSFDRLVVATSSFNGSDWLAFIGCSYTVNSLLNKPLYRVSCTSTSGALRPLTQLLIVGQWVLAVASCAVQDWNAFVISAWILFCSIVSAYAYPAGENARDWLRENNYIEIHQICAEFSCRRAMLTALLYLNPDSHEERTSWINPILADSLDRRNWEAAALAIIKTGSCENASRGGEYWWKYVDEGLEIGREMKRSLTIACQ